MTNNVLMVEVLDVFKTYRRGEHEIRPLRGLSLGVPQGEFLALQGPSGSGKTTLLNLIGGLDRPTSGQIRSAGVEITCLRDDALARWRTTHVGFVFQLYNLIPVLTALENVMLPLMLLRMTGAERRQRAQTALRVVGLGNRLDHYPRQLSGGQEQRVAIARALVTDPDILLADEPTGDLDAQTGAEVLDLLEALNRRFQKTLIVVTHDPMVASRAHRIVTLHDGQL